jgi:MFS family permease
MSGRERPAWLHPTVVGVAGVALLAGYAQFAVTASLPDLAEEFGDATGEGIAAELGMTGTTIGLGLALIRLASVGSLPAAGLADRLGRRRVLLLTAGLGFAITAGAALSPGFWWAVVILALARPLTAAVNAVAGVIAAEETGPADRTAAIALVGGAYAAGTGLVSVVRAVGEDVLGWRGLFALALLPLLALPFVARRVRESPLYASHAAAPTPERRPRLGSIAAGFRRRLVVVCALHLSVGLVLGPIYTYLFLYGEQVVGATPGAMALLVVAAGPAGLFGLLTGRWLADRFGRRGTAGGTMALAAASAILAYSAGFPALAAGYLATIVLGAAYTPAAGALDAELFPTSERATAAGWISAAQVVGQVVGLIGFGLLIDWLGSFTAAGIALWGAVPFLAGLYVLLPETLGQDLDDVRADTT